MKFDVVIFKGDNLADFSEPDTPTLRFNGVDNDELETLTRLVARQEHRCICCLPYPDLAEV